VTPGAVEGVLAPELIHVTSTSALESKLADVFSFGMLAFELLTGTPPFDGQSPARAAFLISQGTRPEFPVDAEDGGLTTQVQDFLRRCWHSNPMERPTIDEVVRTLELFDTNECVRRSSSEQTHYITVLLFHRYLCPENHKPRFISHPTFIARSRKFKSSQQYQVSTPPFP